MSLKLTHEQVSAAEINAAQAFFEGDVLAMRAYFSPINRAKRSLEEARTLRRCDGGCDFAFAGGGKGFWAHYFKTLNQVAFWRGEALKQVAS